ncbi:MAG TPA: GNAT family N-acetyltransferase, partial [Thermoplasmata archaeon]|nr:GNAT family N-acetyltransferase [Thermoplasmata archaeon]
MGQLQVIEYGKKDRRGRSISLREIRDDWRRVADIAPKDDQRPFAPALAARYLLLSDREGVWKSLAVYADQEVVGHVMWARDTDGSYWMGGLLVDRSEQRLGVGRSTVESHAIRVSP